MIMIRDDSKPIGQSLNLPDEVAKRMAVRTDAQGICVFRGLPRASRVRFDDDDDRYALMDYNEVVPLERQGVIEAGPIHLMAAATITGSLIYSDTNKPAGGLGVYAQSIANTGSGTGRSDAKGNFSINRLKPSRYVVAIQPDDDRLGDWTARAAEVDVAQGEHATANLVMVHGGMITGVVRDQETHKGLAGLDIGLHGPAHPRQCWRNPMGQDQRRRRVSHASSGRNPIHLSHESAARRVSKALRQPVSCREHRRTGRPNRHV